MRCCENTIAGILQTGETAIVTLEGGADLMTICTTCRARVQHARMSLCDMIAVRHFRESKYPERGLWSWAGRGKPPSTRRGLISPTTSWRGRQQRGKRTCAAPDASASTASTKATDDKRGMALLTVVDLLQLAGKFLATVGFARK